MKMTELREIAKNEEIKAGSKKNVLIKKIIETLSEEKIEEYFKKYNKTNKIEILEHDLVPKFRRMKESEAEEVLKKYGITKKELPKISIADPMSVTLAADAGDVIEITRKSQTAGKTKYYRVVATDVTSL